MVDKQIINEALRELALFAGAGGGLLGSKLLGWKTVCAVEFDEHARNVLIARQNDGMLEPFPIWDDVSSFDGKQWRGIIDLVSGGFPCQDISVCGKGEGITGARSGLWGEMRRIICEVRPKYAFIENSPALTIRGGSTVLADIASMGYDARWGVFSGYQIGAPIQRERMFILCKDASANKITWVNTESDMFNKNATTLQVWSSSTLTTLLDDAKSRVPIVTGDERVVDGVDYRVERFERIGNGQIPGVVKLAWDTLSKGFI